MDLEDLLFLNHLILIVYLILQLNHVQQIQHRVLQYLILILHELDLLLKDKNNLQFLKNINDETKEKKPIALIPIS